MTCKSKANLAVFINLSCYSEKKLIVMKNELESLQRQRSDQLMAIASEYEKFQVRGAITAASWFKNCCPFLACDGNRNEPSSCG